MINNFSPNNKLLCDSKLATGPQTLIQRPLLSHIPMPSPGMSVTVYRPPYVMAALVFFNSGNLNSPQVAPAVGVEVVKSLVTAP